MHRIVLMIAIALVPLSAGGLQWYHSYDRAMAAAQAAHKNLYVFIDAPGCPYCERMLQDTLSRPSVVRSLSEYVLLNLKLGSRDVRKHFPQTYVTPMSYFVAEDGAVLIDFAGYIDEEFFFWRMGSAEEIDAVRRRKKK